MGTSETKQKESNIGGLLIKAFSQIHDKMYAPSTIREGQKAFDIIQPIDLALTTMGEFGSANDQSTVYLITQIKNKFKGDIFEDQVTEFCDSVMEVVISSNRFVFTYETIGKHIMESVEEYL